MPSASIGQRPAWQAARLRFVLSTKAGRLPCARRRRSSAAFRRHRWASEPLFDFSADRDSSARSSRASSASASSASTSSTSTTPKSISSRRSAKRTPRSSSCATPESCARSASAPTARPRSRGFVARDRHRLRAARQPAHAARPERRRGGSPRLRRERGVGRRRRRLQQRHPRRAPAGRRPLRVPNRARRTRCPRDRAGDVVSRSRRHARRGGHPVPSPPPGRSRGADRARSADELSANVAAFETPVPDGLWLELERQGVLGPT